MPCSLVAVLATDRIRHPSPANAVTRAAWTLASVCHSPRVLGRLARRPGGAPPPVTVPTRGDADRRRRGRARLDVAGDLVPQRRQVPASGVGHELRSRDPGGHLERLDDREPGAVDPHCVLADRVGRDVGQAALDVLTGQLVAVAVQGEPDRRAALVVHGQKLRQPADRIKTDSSASAVRACWGLAHPGELQRSPEPGIGFGGRERSVDPLERSAPELRTCQKVGPPMAGARSGNSAARAPATNWSKPPPGGCGRH